MASANPNPQTVRPAIPLDYGKGTGFSDRMRNLRSEANAHFDGVFRFFGMLIGLIGSARQLIWALGFAFTAAGFGLTIQYGSTGGPILLFVGALLIGLIVPAPKVRRDPPIK